MRTMWLGFGMILMAAVAAAEELPDVEVESVRRVFHNGEHNAFTDLIRFRDRIYLTFRSCPDGHGVHPTASVIVLASADEGEHWEQVHRFSVPRRDTRDPHFLAFQDKLFVFTGTWYCGDSSPQRREMNKHLGYAVWSEDGAEWSEPQMLEGTYGHYIWRAATDGRLAYLCGRRKKEFRETSSRAERDPLVQSALLVSEDGLIWQHRGLFQSDYGNETAFLFEEDGSVLAVARGGGSRNAEVCRAEPPYREFERSDLDRQVGGPLVVKWGERTLVGGRNTKDGPPQTSLYWLEKDRLHEIVELPSGGDNSYPGFLDLGGNRALVSYYSTHETVDSDEGKAKPITAVYLAELKLIE